MSEIVNFDRPYLEYSKVRPNLPPSKKYIGLSVVDSDIDKTSGTTSWDTAFGKISINFNVTEQLCNTSKENPSKNATCICKPPYQKLAKMDEYHNFNGYYCSRYLYVNKN
jgi:hypothetical protein